jgi:hypothetical protein
MIEILSAARVDDLNEGRSVRVTRRLARKVRGVVVRTVRHVARDPQLRHEHAATDLPFPSDVRNVLEEQVTAPDLDVIAFVPEAMQIGATTYQSL